MKKLFFITLCIIGITSFSVFADGDKPADNASMASLSGKVMDLSSGETLVGVAIELEGAKVKTYTDFDGNFQFKDLKPGTYNVVASFISYKNSLVENITVEAGETEQIDIGLQSK